MAVDKNNDVTFLHPMYVKHKDQVTLCNNCYNGIDTVKQYLKPRVNENNTDFTNRASKAIFSNYVERIVTTQAGMIFSKPVTYEDIPDKVVTLLDETDIAQYLKDATKMAIRDGKTYMMVDMATTGSDPYFTHVTREQLTNWRKDEEGKLTFAVIAELYEVVDGFSVEYRTQYRVIEEDGKTDIWREVTNEGWMIYETFNPSYNFIPLYEISVGDTPPLYDIATININHFNAYSEKDSIVSTSTQPSFFTKGLGIDEGEELKIGVNYTINSDNEDADVKWIELDGQSIPYAQDDLDRKEKMMADRALQIQSESKKVQTATQVSIENSESSSRLDDIADNVQDAANQSFNAWYQMKYSTDAVGKIIVPTDFKSEVVDSNIVIGLNNLVIAGNLSKATMLAALVKHEIIDVESIDEEIERIDEEFIPLEETTSGDNSTNPSESQGS